MKVFYGNGDGEVCEGGGSMVEVQHGSGRVAKQGVVLSQSSYMRMRR